MQLKTGDRVRVDGGRGVVEILYAKRINASSPPKIGGIHPERINDDASQQS